VVQIWFHFSQNQPFTCDVIHGTATDRYWEVKLLALTVSLISERCLRRKHKRQNNPFTGSDRPWGFEEDEAPRFQDNRHMKVVRLSALRTGRLYSSGNIPSTHFCWRLSQPKCHCPARRREHILLKMSLSLSLSSPPVILFITGLESNLRKFLTRQHTQKSYFASKN